MKKPDTFQLLCDCISPLRISGEATEQLSRQLLNGNVQWESLVAIANRQSLCPTLYAALNRRGLLGSIPADVRQYLTHLYEGNGKRNHRLLALTAETVRHLNEVGVEPVLLKGTANLCSGLYPDPNMRFLCDIDLLVPPDRIADCQNRLLSAGYEHLFERQAWLGANHIHYPPLLKKNHSIRVELGGALAPGKYRKILDASNVLHDATRFMIGDARALMPSANHRLIHNVVHAQLSDKCFARGEIQLRQLLDFILLGEASGRQADWSLIAKRFRQIHSDALSGYLFAGRRFFGWPPPPEIRPSMNARAYHAWLCAQIRHPQLMRFGNIHRMGLFYRERLAYCLAMRRIPRFWDRDFRQRHLRILASMLRRSW